jgi:N-hydroxyarylamine O-acetyltransferase
LRETRAPSLDTAACVSAAEFEIEPARSTSHRHAEMGARPLELADHGEFEGSPMKLDDYLERIDYRGPVALDRACLTAIHRHHLAAIPYEDLDVQLGRPLDLDPERSFEKLVERRRGGWCYEMNGLLCWALQQIGFTVTRMVGGVNRATRGDEAMGNHLVLCVSLETPLLADVGLGDGIVEPTRIEEGRFTQAGREFGLERLEDELWRFHNREGAFPASFDFAREPNEDQLAQTCRNLQQDADSLFRQNVICMQPDELGEMKILLGRVLALPGEEKKVLETADAFCESLEVVFGLSDPGFRDLWPQVVARHREIFGD